MEETLILRLHSPEDIRELISKKNYLEEKIPDFKLTELTYSIDKKNNCDELTFNKKDIKEDKEAEILKFNSREKKIY